jgi:hypothetical protein
VTTTATHCGGASTASGVPSSVTASSGLGDAPVMSLTPGTYATHPEPSETRQMELGGADTATLPGVAVTLLGRSHAGPMPIEGSGLQTTVA